jgi:beta-lactamase regulating signal transducer with metallopeptidase domain
MFIWQGATMTMTPVRRTSRSTLPDRAELLIKEAHQNKPRRRLRFVAAVLIMLVAAAAVWQGSGGGTVVKGPLAAS